MRLLTCLAVFTMAFICVTDANAQGRRGGFRMGPAMLLGLQQVQEELDLNEEQLEKVGKMSEEMRANRGGQGGEGGRGAGRPGGRGGDGAGGRGGEGGRAGGRGGEGGRGGAGGRGGEGGRGGAGGRGGGGRGAESSESELARIADILDEKQMARLKQIALQVRGAQALMEEKVAEELGLSEENIEEMQETQEEANLAMRDEMMELFSAGDREAAMEKLPELRKAASDKVIALLSDEQKSKYEAMIGEPFELDMRAAMESMRRGRGGQGGGRGGRGGEGGRASGRPGGRGGDGGGTL